MNFQLIFLINYQTFVSFSLDRRRLPFLIINILFKTVYIVACNIQQFLILLGFWLPLSGLATTYEHFHWPFALSTLTLFRVQKQEQKDTITSGLLLSLREMINYRIQTTNELLARKQIHSTHLTSCGMGKVAPRSRSILMIS